ncbi:MAG: hypothetical protein ACFFCQ_07115 [Promethearchaeota archaeon]
MILDEKKLTALIEKVEGIPPFCLEKFLDKAINKKVDIPQESDKRKEFISKLLQSFNTRNLVDIRRLSWLTSLNSPFLPYLIQAEHEPNFLDLNGGTFQAADFLEQHRIHVSGYIQSFKLTDESILITIEFRSRSPYYRSIYRGIGLPKRKVMLIENKDLAMDLFDTLIMPNLYADLKKIPITARMVRKVAYTLEAESLQFEISTQTSGVRGLRSITLHGENVLQGIESVKSRHELEFFFDELGPWTSVSTQFFAITIQRGIDLLKISSDGFEMLGGILAKK